ncbi:MAG: prepilin-type N-terminal cleavage/methylation domain-containing protein [Candidatus Gastranaerophilales bacterium]|nr:prepilin-type N-terminal cleavage/methylation domain-containing protein [Candidatus Gastranaerophilales bacterium]
MSFIAKMQQSKNKIIRRLGFTLAETLIVIAIIGIIASIVTPMLFGTTNDAELKAKWKKEYADLSQATMMIIADNGGSLVGAFPGVTAGSEDLKNAYAEKLNIIKNCSGTSARGGSGTGATAEGCWHETEGFYRLNGEVNPDDMSTYPGLILNNGTFIVIKNNSSSCSELIGDYTKCAKLTVDLNGLKKPNTWGKDIFGLNVTATSAVAKGAQGAYDPAITCIEGSTETTNSGKGCSAKYLYE